MLLTAIHVELPGRASVPMMVMDRALCSLNGLDEQLSVLCFNHDWNEMTRTTDLCLIDTPRKFSFQYYLQVG